ncbi:MAG: hypothetical protein HN467_16060 [Opitutae bacterium]|nr:hypothetical protein [Opitutae bacterium]
MKPLFVFLLMVLCLPAFGDILKRMIEMAEGGDVESQLQLAQIHASGRLGQPDFNASFKWSKMAADQGNANGQYAVARAYRIGQGVPKDEKEGMAWLRKAADSGNAQAQFELGLALYNGQGMPKNAKEGVAWLRKASSLGNPVAQSMLATLILKGEVEGRHPKEAPDLLLQSATQGNLMSIFFLGALFQNGKFLEQDSVYSYGLISLAVAQGYSQAAGQLEQLNKSFPPEIIARGKQLAANPQEMFQRIHIEKIGYVPVAGSPNSLLRVDQFDDAFVDRNLIKSVGDKELNPGTDKLTGGFVMTGPDEKPYTGWVKIKSPEGRLTHFYELVRGEANGMSIEWYPNGKRKKQGRITHGFPPMPIGLWIYYKEDGTEDYRKKVTLEDLEKFRQEQARESARLMMENMMKKKILTRDQIVERIKKVKASGEYASGLTFGEGRLNLEGSRIKDLSLLHEVPKLKSLNLNWNRLSDLTPLAKMTHLTVLELGHNALTDLSPLAGIESLRSLSLFSNPVSDLKPLAGLVNLSTLNLMQTEVSDLGPLSGLKNLKELNLTKTRVKDVSPLAKLTGLRKLYLIDCTVPEDHQAILRKALPECDISFREKTMEEMTRDLQKASDALKKTTDELNKRLEESE